MYPPTVDTPAVTTVETAFFYPRSIFRPYKVYFQHQIGEGQDILLVLALESSLLQPLLKTNKQHKSTRIIPFLATLFMY